MDGQVLMWPRGKTINDAIMIGVAEGGLYNLKGCLDQALVHSTINPCELWHRRFARLNYQALPIVSKAVIGIPELQANHEGVCKGCIQGKNVKSLFPSSDNKEKGILDMAPFLHSIFIKLHAFIIFRSRRHLISSLFVQRIEWFP